MSPITSLWLRHRGATAALLVPLALTACGRGGSTAAAGPTTTVVRSPASSTPPGAGLALPTTTAVVVSLPTTAPTTIPLPSSTTTSSTSTIPPCEIHVTLTNEAVGFAFDSTEVSAVGQEKLDQVGRQLVGSTDVTVTGYTSSEGSTEYNADLSRRRAEAVAAVLRPNLPGVPVSAIGAGELDPVVPDDDTEDERAQNRRVTIVGHTPQQVCP